MQAVVFPFDQFGSAGTGAGAQLLADALREMLDDAKREIRPARSDAYRDKVQIREFTFDTPQACADWRKTARQAVRSALRAGDPVIWLAGNHLGVLPAYEELGADALVLQFDAHLDAYNLADCTEELSHGNFMLHADGPLPRIINIGSRDLFLPDKHVRESFGGVYSAEDVVTDPGRVIHQLNDAARTAKQVWLDVDCDVFDPAFFSAVQHPLPMGLSPNLLLRVFAAVWSERVAGVSFSEFDPGRDRNDQSLGTLVWLLEWCLLRWSERD
jgi:arginase family enzyme